MIVNELLTYAKYYINNSTFENLKKLMLSFYTPEEILIAKRLLWEVCGNHLDNLTERKTTDKRTSEDANLNDLLSALIAIDANNVTTEFVAKDLLRLPKRAPEELNVTSLLERIVNLEDAVNRSEETLSHHTVQISELSLVKNCTNKLNILENKVQEHGIALADIIAKEKIIDQNHNSNLQFDDNEVRSDSDIDWIDLDPNGNDKPCYIYQKFIQKNRNKRRKTERKKKISNDINNRDSVNSSCNWLQRGRQTDTNSKYIKRNNLISRNNNSSDNNNNFHVTDYQLEGAQNTKKYLYIGRVTKGTQESIVNYISSKGLDCVDVTKVSRESSTFKSFRLTVINNNNYQLMLKSDFWPTGVVVKPWIDFKSRQSYGKKEYFNSNFKFTKTRN